MAILRERDPRIGCLAVPLSLLAGFVVAALVAAALGAGSGTSTVTGLVGAGVAVVVAGVVLRRAPSGS